MINWLVDWLINRAMRTPYFHLPGYMERYWLVPYNVVIEREISVPFGHASVGARYVYKDTDGTGPVNPWRRPFARLLQKLGIAVRIHHILRSDQGRDPHDHPWPFVTVILRGGYFEHRFDQDGAWAGIKWYGAGSILFRRAKDFHILELPPGKTAWTLFITGPKQQTWGFKPVHGPKIPYYQYKGEA